PDPAQAPLAGKQPGNGKAMRRLLTDNAQHQPVRQPQLLLTGIGHDPTVMTGPAYDAAARAAHKKRLPIATTTSASSRRMIVSGILACNRAPTYPPARPPMPSAIPVGQLGATLPCW